MAGNSITFGASFNVLVSEGLILIYFAVWEAVVVDPKMEDCSRQLGGTNRQADTKRGKAERSNTKQDKENNDDDDDDNNNGSYNGNNKHKQELTNSFSCTLQNWRRRRVASVCVAHNNDNGQRDNFYTITSQTWTPKTATWYCACLASQLKLVSQRGKQRERRKDGERIWIEIGINTFGLTIDECCGSSCLVALMLKWDSSEVKAGK